MLERERQETQQRPGRNPVAHDPALDSLRADAASLLHSADEAIAQAMSADSKTFLKANRQTGGQ